LFPAWFVPRQIKPATPLTFLEANAEELASKYLLKHVTCRIGLIRKWQLQHGWAQAGESYARAWPLLRIFKSRRNAAAAQHPEKAIATSVLSNLGSVFKTAKLPTEQGQVRIGIIEIHAESFLYMTPSFLPTAVNAATACLT